MLQSCTVKGLGNAVSHRICVLPLVLPLVAAQNCRKHLNNLKYLCNFQSYAMIIVLAPSHTEYTLFSTTEIATEVKITLRHLRSHNKSKSDLSLCFNCKLQLKCSSTAPIPDILIQAHPTSINLTQVARDRKEGN